MVMTDKDNIILEDFFKQAAQQQIEDNGFTERVMQNLPKTNTVRRLSRLWSLFCILVGGGGCGVAIGDRDRKRVV